TSTSFFSLPSYSLFLVSLDFDVTLMIKGFSDLTPEEISTATGIDISSAKLAKKRFYSEPIIIEGDKETIHEVKQMISSSGLNFMEGGRFHHVFGTTTDKGKAVRMLINIYKDNFTDSIKTIGLGDSLIDLPMLATVDIPILVKKSSGNYDKRIQLPNLIYADGIGPEGWNKAILKIFKNIMPILFLCILLIHPASAETISGHKAQYVIDNSTITRIQKPLLIRTDRETLEYFMEHAEELTKHGKDFREKELVLEVKGNGRYGIQMPARHITGEFELVERQPQKVI
ncbi:MAG: HAD-IIB family hydrolase, partial [Candidatus Brocadia sp.]